MSILVRRPSNRSSYLSCIYVYHYLEGVCIVHKAQFYATSNPAVIYLKMFCFKEQYFLMIIASMQCGAKNTVIIRVTVVNTSHHISSFISFLQHLGM
jgi:hypothetical protein